jgi:glycosyltransferase involved in cell wall biosynthesis
MREGSITAIVPTYNRKEVLRRALVGYSKQSAPDFVHELLVIDDGSTDGTRSAVEQAQSVAPFRIRYLYQDNRGPAAARNRGIEEARTSVVLFTDDDMIPHPDLVSEHVKWHREYPESYTAIRGFVTWSPELCPTAFMKWYGEAGPFAIKQLRHRREVDFRFFHSCNLSLKKDFLKASGGFNENFKTAAYEDIELGFRLSNVGMRLLYNPDGITYHYQSFTFAEACQKIRRATKARELFFRTEAGKCVSELQNGRESLYRVAWPMAACLGTIFQPSTRLLDSSVPLPGIVYRSLLWYHAGQSGDTRGVRDVGPSRD